MVAKVIASGVTFLDGSRELTITKADLNADGTYILKLYKDSSRVGANCHTVFVYQDGVQVGQEF